jgi:hypothetical protein
MGLPANGYLTSTGLDTNLYNYLKVQVGYYAPVENISLSPLVFEETGNSTGQRR